jgi:hypothetical protein
LLIETHLYVFISVQDTRIGRHVVRPQPTI